MYLANILNVVVENKSLTLDKIVKIKESIRKEEWSPIDLDILDH